MSQEEKPQEANEKRIRSPIAVVLGHVDSGKCVTGDTEILLASGDSKPAKVLFHELTKQAYPLDSNCYELNQPVPVFTLSNEGITTSEITHVWQFPTTHITKVTLQNGVSVQTTPEHKYLVVAQTGDIIAKKASELTTSDYLIYPVRPLLTSKSRVMQEKKVVLQGTIKLKSHQVMITPLNDEQEHKIKVFFQKVGIPFVYSNHSFTIQGVLGISRFKQLFQNELGQDPLFQRLTPKTDLVLESTPVSRETVNEWVLNLCLSPTILSVSLGTDWLLEPSSLLHEPTYTYLELKKIVELLKPYAECISSEPSVEHGGTHLQLLNHSSELRSVNSIQDVLTSLHALLSDALLIKVARVETLNYDQPVYDFTVKGTHNFIANGLCIHNTSLLDKVRGTAVQIRETGGITQHVGASFFPSDTILKAAGKLAEAYKVQLKIPGILIIDTPGHAAFMNLRTRGASVADIAILVVDITRGFQAQTYESMDILKRRRTPFIVALNKVDRLSGWKPKKNAPFVETIKYQNKKTVQYLDEKIYEVMGELSSLGLLSERYDRIQDYTKNVAIIPTSAHTGEGIPDLFLILAGLTQQFLMKQLKYSVGPARGVVLEVKEEEGMGMTMDTIIYDGVITSDDLIVVGTTGEPEVSRVRALLLPKELDEMRDPRDKFRKADKVFASAGVKIIAPDIHNVIAGAPLLVAINEEDAEQKKQEIMEELSFIKLQTDKEGIILKADTLGSLEALVGMLKERNIPIRIATVGDITKRDVMEAMVTAEKHPSLGAILGFRVGFQAEAEEEAAMNGIPIFTSDIIYGLVDEYEAWKIELEEKLKREQFEDIQKPGKIQIMNGFVFRQSNPAVVGVEVLAGSIKPRDVLIREDGKKVGTILQIQENRQNIQEASVGKQVAVSIKGPTVGRQIKEGMVLYRNIRPRDARLLLNKYRSQLSKDEQEALDELVRIKQRAESKFWPFV